MVSLIVFVPGQSCVVKSSELFQFISASLGLATCTLKIGLEAICDNVSVLIDEQKC